MRATLFYCADHIRIFRIPIFVFGQHYLLHSSAEDFLASLLLDQHPHDGVKDIVSDLGLHLPLLFILSVGVNENCPCQWISWEFPSAQPGATFLAGVAVAVPISFFRNSDCFLASHADTSGACDKGVRELFQCSQLWYLQGLTVPQLVVGLLQHRVLNTFHLELLEV